MRNHIYRAPEITGCQCFANLSIAYAHEVMHNLSGSTCALQDDSVRIMPNAWLPIPLQRVLAFAIACAMCNSVTHAFSLVPAGTLPGHAVSCAKAAIAGLL